MSTHTRVIVRTVLFWVIRVSFVFGMLYAFFVSRDFATAWLVTAGLVLSFIPQLIRRSFDVRLPTAYELAIVVFIYASLFLGEFVNAYNNFWWWDKVLHALSGVMLGYVGFMILVILNMQKQFTAGPKMVAFFTFSTAMASAGLWEIVEFTVDKLGYGPMQHGLEDTMWDIILASGGAVLATVVAYWHFRWPETSPVAQSMDKFRTMNKKLKRRKRTT